MLNCILEISFCLETLSEDRQEVIYSGGFKFGMYRSDSDGLFVDHFHDLPL